MLRASPVPDAEEWAIHDYEGFEGVRVAEYAGIDGVAETAAFVAEHGRFELAPCKPGDAFSASRR